MLLKKYVELNTALSLAMEYHKNQVDKAGLPYILHPLHIMDKVKSIDAKIVAILHDTLEDTDLTADLLLKKGISPENIYRIQLLTHSSNIKYFDYIKRIKDSNDPITIEVKEQDLLHNSDLSRLKYITEKDYNRHLKYLNALKILHSEEKENGIK